MLNYRVDPALLHSRVPAGTVLETWQGEAYLSVVGFLFRRTRVLGFAIPWHQDFEEVNLRFYVRREMPSGEVRRGVTFIREIVPRRAIATIARLAYNEPYLALPMRHHLGQVTDPERAPGHVEFGWRQRRSSGWSRCSSRRPAGRNRWSRARRRSSSPSTTGATRGSATPERSSTR